MSFFFDLHTHMLFGTDDGAKSAEDMYAMLNTAYDDGIRAFCLTPHYSPYHFGDTTEEANKAFAILSEYVERNHPDVTLYLANELGYYSGCIESLNQGNCRSLGGGRFVLVDFPHSVTFFELKTAMETMFRAGYLPVLAHTERYHCLRTEFDWIEEFVERGGKIQINVSSVIGKNGLFEKGQCKRLLSKKLAHVVSTDAHNLTTRPPVFSICLDRLRKLCDANYVYDLTWKNAERIIKNERF